MISRGMTLTLRHRWLVILTAGLLLSSLGIVYSVLPFAHAARGGHRSVSNSWLDSTALKTANAATSSTSATPAQSAIVAAYWGMDSARWQQLDANHPAGTVAIANINAGPGSSYSSTLANEITQAQASGVRVIGYVYTRDGARPLADAKADVAKWYSWYRIDGIFVDNTSHSATQDSYYSSLSSTIRSQTGGKGNLIVLNVGWTPDQSYMSYGDILVTFEDVYSLYTTLNSTTSWMLNYPTSRFATFVLSTTPSDMQAMINLSRQRHIGYLFVSDGSPSTAYATLPSYWSTEVSSLIAR